MRAKRIALVVAVAAGAAALLLPAAGSGAAAPKKLVASVGPGFTISLTSGGKKVTTLQKGVYEIAVSDKSSAHNFHLFGPGLSWVFTTVPAVVNETITLTLRAGNYRYVCDPHASTMKGAFKVT
jgi:plastocyanin